MNFRSAFTPIAASLALVISLVNTLVPLERARAVPQAQVSTALTYQGRLDDGGAPANGSYDFQFALFNAATGGSQIGSTLTVNGVTVTKGLFTVLLDFGNPFWQQQTYLEARVRKAGDPSFTTLTPRQLVSAAPVASALPGVYADQPTQFVGIGRANKITGREVFGINADFSAFDPASYGGMYINTVAPVGRPFYGYATGGTPRAWTTYNPNPDGLTTPDPNNGAWEVHNMLASTPLLQARSDRVAQSDSSNGLVKAGVVASCSSPVSFISRQFVSIVMPSPTPPPTVTIAWSSAYDGCVIDFGFTVNTRYFSAMAVSSDARFVACAPAPVSEPNSSQKLVCKRFTDAGVRENGFISVMIY